MLRSLFAAILIAVATPALAFEIETMTPQERDSFRSEVRDYLLEDPEVLMEAIAVLEERRAQQAVLMEKQLLEDYRAEIFEDDFSFVGGNPDGDVTVVEFFDYRCSYCKRAHPEVQSLVEADGGIRIIFKEFPILGPESEMASRYAIATKLLEGDDAYAVVHDKLMEWSGAVNEGALGRISGGTGVDHEAILAHMNSDDVTAIIATNRQLAQVLQIQGTPSFVMGDAFLRGYLEPAQMRSMVEAVRADQG